MGVAPGPVLLAADSALIQLGMVSRVEGLLKAAGFRPTVHGQIAGEPDLAGAEAIVATVRAAEYGAVIGLGGGSAMDPAKLAAGLATNEGPVLEYLRGRQIQNQSLPLALVPTTAGTGAEASKNTIVTHEGRKFVVSSHLLCPTLAVLDPKLTLSCPRGVTAASGMDALAHAVEATLSLWATPFTTINALAAARIVARWLPVVYEDGANLPARRAMLYAAHLAGVAINASTLLGHSLAAGELHPLGQKRLDVVDDIVIGRLPRLHHRHPNAPPARGHDRDGTAVLRCLRSSGCRRAGEDVGE